MAGHCVRYPELPVSNLILREPIHGETLRGGQSLTCFDQIRRDTGLCSMAEIKTCMEDHVVWQCGSRRPDDDDDDGGGGGGGSDDDDDDDWAP